MKTSETLRRWLRILTMLSPGTLLAPETVARDLEVDTRVVRSDFSFLSRLSEIDVRTSPEGRLGLGPSGYRRLTSLFRRVGEIDW